MFLLFDDLELLDQDPSKLLHDMRAIVGCLEADNDLLDDIIVDTGQVNLVVGSMEVVVKIHLDGDSSVKAGGGRWGVGDDLAAFVGSGGRVA